MGKLRHINFADRKLYYNGNGRPKGACTISVEYTFTEDIQPELLKRAAGEASRYIWPFRQSLVIHDGALMHEEIDAEPPVFPRAGKLYYLGTPDTNGYMYFILYEGKTMCLRFAHGLGDGFTGVTFCRFVTGLYLSYMYPDEVSFDAESEYQKLNIWQGEDQFDYIKDADRHSMASVKPSYRLPKEKYFGDEEVCCIDMPLDAFKQRISELGTSPVPFIMALLGRAARKTYKVGRRPVSGLVMADLRRVFDRNTMDGFMGYAIVPYEPAYDDMDLAEACRALRRGMDERLGRESIAATHAIARNILRLQESKWLSKGLLKILGEKAEALATRMGYTYAITHVSLKRMHEECFGKVTSIEPFATSVGDLALEMYSRQDTMSIRIPVYIGGRALIDNFRAELAAEGLQSEYSVRRDYDNARIDFSALRTV